VAESYGAICGGQIDITVLRKLAEVTNVVPIIAKSDSLTLQEREAFKERVSGEISRIVNES
jgi:septin 3/9/12